MAVVPGPYVMLAISDTGTGMDAVTQSHVFDPFFTTKKTGTGLGLSTVYGIVRQSGGYIWVYSESGKGTTFKIYLPRVNAEVQSHAPRPGPESHWRGSETVLLVEDSVRLRAVARRFLERAGYTVLEAVDGSDAVQLAADRGRTIELLLTDVVMAGMSGPEVAERVRVLQPAIRTLFVSGYTDDAIVHHGVLEEGVALLSKPFTGDRLLHKVRFVLDA